MAKTHFVIIWSFAIINTQAGPIFCVVVFPFKWFESDVKGMFHSLLAFLKEVCPLSMMSIASSSCWFVHFECTKIGVDLLIKCVCVVGAYMKG